MPPGYPALVAAVTAAGLPLVEAGAAVSLVSYALIPGAVLLAARAAGASRGASVCAGLASLACADLMGLAQQLQPDASAALAAVALGGLLAAGASGDRRAIWAAAAVGGLSPLLREHGLVLAGITVFTLFFLPGGRAAALATLAVFWAGPLLVGVIPGLSPLDTHWGARPGGALGALLDPSLDQVPYARTLPPGPRATYLGMVEQADSLGLLQFHAARSLHLAWDGWLLLGAALLAALLARRRAELALALPVLAAAPALLIWSQRRHVLVLLPVALAALAASRWTWPRAERARLVGLVALALTLAQPWARSWSALGPAQRTEAPRARTYATIARWITEHGPPGALLGGVFQDIGLYARLPRHDPDGSPADWLTFVVSDLPLSNPGWEKVSPGSSGMGIYQLEPERSPRPCAGARPAPDTPHIAVAAAHAELIDVDAACVEARSR